MYEFKVNKKKNAMLCILIGKFTAAEAYAYNKKYAACVDTLSPGFSLLVDLTQFTPTTEEIREIFLIGTQNAVAKGLKRVVRIVSDSITSTTGNIQWNRGAKGLGYEVDIVHSMREAEKVLGWK
jgi:hypothetical protein